MNEQLSVNMSESKLSQGIHVVAKPIGPACNLNCEYCFYLEKQALFGPANNTPCPKRSFPRS